MKEFDIKKWNWNSSSKLVVLTGAGISAESGINTFRGAGGLWEQHSLEDVCTPEGYYKNPKLVIDFYNDRRKQLADVSPNLAHKSLARLEKLIDNKMFLITQNVDDLHERAGSRQVLHMHGELLKLRCNNNERHIIDFTGNQNYNLQCQYENCTAKMRPHIVWFGEMPLSMDLIDQKLKEATHFIYIGTSSKVYPAAGFKQIAKSNGAKVLCINLDIEEDIFTDFYLKGKAGDSLPKFVEDMQIAYL